MSKIKEIVLLTSAHTKVEQPAAIPSQILSEELNNQIEELGIKVAKGQQEKADRNELNKLLNHILSYPSTKQAEIHRKANRLGGLDVDKQERYNRISNKAMWKQTQFTHICKCCGFIIQENSLNLCEHRLEDIQNLGISTFLYFKTIINLSILLAIMFIVYSTYSVATNIKASGLNINGNQSSTVLNVLSISLGSKQLYSSSEKSTMYVIGAWIGMGMLVLWAVTFMGLKYYQKQSEVLILMQNKSVSEYSLVIENIPTGLTRIQVQRYFKHYLQLIKQRQQVNIDDIEVVKYNQGQPFYFNESEFKDQKLNFQLEMTKQYLDMFRRWIEHRRSHPQFNSSQAFRIRKYKEYERIVSRKKNLVNDITNQVKEHYHTKNKSNLTTAFVTFATNHQKNFVLDYNSDSLISRLKNSIPCLKNQNRFTIEREETVFNMRISPAPDPEDIVWTNIGVSLSQIWGRKLLTYSITLLILAISFVIAYSLSTAQASNQSNKILSIAISLMISLMNLVMGLVIELVTSYERDYTMTNYQISLHIKTVFAQLINSIFIPITVNYFIKQNIYGENGLIQDVLILGITNSLVYPIGKLINPAYLLRYFYAKYKSWPSNKLSLHQFQLNQLYQKQEFQIGYQYIYVVNLFIFTCFFVSLQPILPIFAILGLFLIYWVMKHNLYHRCQRPVPGTPIINTAASQLIYFGAVAYTLGSMTWANFLPESQFKQALLPNLFALSASVIIFLLPYQTIFRTIFKNMRMPEVLYSANRIFFTSEYDRLNPSTSEAGVKDYYLFLQNKIKQIEEKDDDFKIRLSYNLEHNNRPNFYRQPDDNFGSASKYEGRQVISNIIKKQSKNSITPQMISTVLMKDRCPHRQAAAAANNRIKQSLARIKRQKQILDRDSLQLPRQGLEIQKKLDNLKEEQSEQYLEQLPKVDSFKLELEGKVSGFSYNNKSPSLQQSQCQPYFPDVSQVKSFILKAQDKPSIQPGQKRKLSLSKQPRESQGDVGSKVDSSSKPEIISKLEISSKPEIKGKSSISLVQEQIPDKSRVSRPSISLVEQFPQKNKRISEDYVVSSIPRVNQAHQITFQDYMNANKQESQEILEQDLHDEVVNRFSINQSNILALCLENHEQSLLESQVRFYNLACFQ